MEIKIISDMIESATLKQLLETKTDQVVFELRPRTLKLRNTDPTIVVAVVGAASTAVIALISSIFSVVKEKQLGKIVIESKDGTKIEIPANYPPEKLGAIIEKIRQLDAPRILIAK